MFTGIVEELGTVVAAGTKLEVRCSMVLSDLSIGASVAVNGVCLTAVTVTPEGFTADLAPETLSRTNLGDLAAGSRVNLERPVTPATRLSGHIVQGHVDATGEVVTLDALGDSNWWLKVRAPKSLDRYLVEKGSVTLDGISLTIAALEAGPVIGVTIIPHTYTNTSMCQARVGTRINIEVDVLAKHVEKLIAGMRLG
ncbi:MAG TPA: riboflavin synthase [Bryobacteraceae bacterium]|nr:riboflavin synthase [Bryobacteraceae bacterium]